MGGMIPLADESRRPVSFPVASTAIIGINFAVFIVELIGGDQFVTRWSEIPADVVAGHHWITLLNGERRRDDKKGLATAKAGGCLTRQKATIRSSKLIFCESERFSKPDRDLAR